MSYALAMMNLPSSASSIINAVIRFLDVRDSVPMLFPRLLLKTILTRMIIVVKHAIILALEGVSDQQN
jgi:hypothetical protein